MTSLIQQINGLAFLSEDEPSKASRDTTTEGDSSLERITSEVMNPSSADIRFVLFLNEKELSSHYLKSGGGKEVVDLMDDAEVTAIAKADYDNTRLKQFTTPNFDLIDLLKPTSFASSANRAVLIDVPKSLVTELQSINRRASSAMATPADKDALKEHLKKMMSHKLYVLTLNIPKAKKISGMTRSKGGVEKWVEVFDPSVISNYPIKQVLVSAKDEWDEAHDEESKEEARVASLESKAKRDEREDAATTAPKVTKLKKQLINLIIANGSKSDSEVATLIKNGTSAGNSQEDVVKELSSLSTEYGASRFADISIEVAKITPWR